MTGEARSEKRSRPWQKELVCSPKRSSKLQAEPNAKKGKAEKGKKGKGNGEVHSVKEKGKAVTIRSENAELKERPQG